MFAARMLVRRPWALMVALGIVTSGSGRVGAAAIESSSSRSYSYYTSGSIGGPGSSIYGTGIGGLSYYGNSGAIAGPGALVLGSFGNSNVSLPEGAELSFQGVPFTVNLSIYSTGGPDYRSQNLVLRGVLDGSFRGPNQTDLLATITEVRSTWDSGGLILDPLDLKAFPQTIAWNGSGWSTSSSLVGYIDTALNPVPEPGTLAVFGLAMAGALAWRARRRP